MYFAPRAGIEPASRSRVSPINSRGRYQLRSPRSKVHLLFVVLSDGLEPSPHPYQRCIPPGNTSRAYLFGAPRRIRTHIPSVWSRRSCQLEYERRIIVRGGPGQTRTGNTLLFRQVLYAIGATDPCFWCLLLGSNQGPIPYQEIATATELSRHVVDPRGGIEPPSSRFVGATPTPSDER